VAVKQGCGPSEADYRELVDAGLYTEADVEQWERFGGYTGYRVGIAADGEWLSFVAGD
jgi:hypothetical protein